MKHKISHKVDLFEMHITCMATLVQSQPRVYKKIVEWYEGPESGILNANNLSVFNVVYDGYVVQVIGYNKRSNELHVIRVWGDEPSLSVDQIIRCDLFKEDEDG